MDIFLSTPKPQTASNAGYSLPPPSLYNLAKHRDRTACKYGINIFIWNSIIRSWGRKLQIILSTMPFSTLTILYSVIRLKLKLQKTLGERLMNTKVQRVKSQKKIWKWPSPLYYDLQFAGYPSIFWAFSGKISVQSSLWYYSPHSYNHLSTFGNCAVNPCVCFYIQWKFSKRSGKYS